MESISKEAKGLVANVIGYLQSSGKAKSTVPKVQLLLEKVTEQARIADTANVTSAVTLTSAEKTALTKIISGHVGHEITLKTNVNPEIGGGLKIQVGDWIIDASLEGQLAQLSQSLT